MEIFGVPSALLGSQLLVGLINGSFYAILSLGLAIIFGLLNIINFAHGAQYMMGAFVAWIALTKFGINYWVALFLSPVIIGALGVVIERTMLRKLYKLDHLYGLLLTFGLALIFEGLFRDQYGISGQSYPVPELLQGGVNLGFMFLPIYRGWVVVAALTVCFGTWFIIEKTKLGAYLRAGTENPQMVQALGINVPLLITFTYGFGVALAAFLGLSLRLLFFALGYLGKALPGFVSFLGEGLTTQCAEHCLLVGIEVPARFTFRTQGLAAIAAEEKRPAVEFCRHRLPAMRTLSR